MIVSYDRIIQALQHNIRSPQHQPAVEIIGLIPQALLKLADHPVDVRARCLRLRRRMPIPVGPKRVKAGGGGNHDDRSERSQHPARSIAQERKSDRSSGDCGHDSGDDEECVHRFDPVLGWFLGCWRRLIIQRHARAPARDAKNDNAAQR